MARGKTTEACDKLSESYRLEKTLGTLLNLAMCHEKDGRLATARAEFEELEATATHDNQASRAQFARERMAAIDPKVNKLTVSVSSTESTTSVTLDGADLPRAAWGIATSIDPGKHVVEVTAPGKITWTRDVEVSGEGRSLQVEVPALVDVAPAAPAAPIAPPPQAAQPHAERGGPSALSLGLLGGGVVAIGIGGFFGAKAMAAQAEARGRCERGGCDAQAAKLLDEKSSSSLVATVSVTAGVVAACAGIYMLVRGSPWAARAPSGRSPGLVVGSSGALLGGAF